MFETLWNFKQELPHLLFMGLILFEKDVSLNLSVMTSRNLSFDVTNEKFTN